MKSFSVLEKCYAIFVLLSECSVILLKFELYCKGSLQTLIYSIESPCKVQDFPPHFLVRKFSANCQFLRIYEKFPHQLPENKVEKFSYSNDLPNKIFCNIFLQAFFKLGYLCLQNFIASYDAA